VSTCRTCGVSGAAECICRLPVFVSGSEGVDLCLQCRLVVTDVIRGMIRAHTYGKKEAFKSMAGKDAKP
jgi:hypothetical protein